MSTSSDPSGGGPASQGRKTKKRVALHTIGENGDATGLDSSDPISGSAQETPSSRNSGEWMLPPTSGAESSRQSSPLPSPALRPSQPLSPLRSSEPKDLRLALHRALLTAQAEQQEESKGQGQEQMGAGADAEDSLPTSPKPLKPAFKRNTSYRSLRELEEVDPPESQETSRQVRAMASAQKRADLLAASIKMPDSTRSAPGSRRSSLERVDDSYFPPAPPISSPSIHCDGKLNSDESEAGPRWRSSRLRPPPVRWQAQYPHGEEEQGEEQQPSRDRRGCGPDQDEESHIAQSYSKQSVGQSFYPRTPSGTATPALMDEDAQVPGQENYKGSLLGSILKLWRNTGSSDDSGQSRSGFSSPTTAPSTPAMSPAPSPPSSRSPSPSRPASKSRSYGLRKSASSASLGDLLKSSSVSASASALASADQLKYKLKKAMPRPKKDKENIRIKIHIADILARHRYLLKLCRALMMYGAPTHRLEEYMAMSSRVLEIEGQFLYIPSCMLISFDDRSTHTTEVKLVRVPQGIDLGRLREVHEVYKLVVHDLIGVEEATQRLEEILHRGPKFSRAFRVLMYGIASSCVAPFAFQGRWIDLPIAFFLGCIVGTLQLVFAPSNELYAHVFEVTAAVITSFVARGFGSIKHGHLFCFSALAQSSIALILPGYMVLCSSLELQSYNMVSGSVRMVHALVYTLFLGYGITIGASAYGMFDKRAVSTTSCSRPLDANWNLIFVPAFTLCLCVINQARWKQMPVMVVISLLGYITNSYSGKYFVDSPQIPNMLGALCVGVLANLYSRLGGYAKYYWHQTQAWWKSKSDRRFPRVNLFPRRTPEAREKRPSVDLESNMSQEDEKKKAEIDRKSVDPRKLGFNLAAAAMLPAIFVQVPSGLAAGGSLLAGVNSANAINSNHTEAHPQVVAAAAPHMLDGSPFSVLFSVIQVSISLSVGLFLSHLLVYPFGKRRSGLFSF